MRLLALFLVAGLCGQAYAEPFKVLSWNVESDRDNQDTNDPNVIADELAEIQASQGPFDLIGLVEVVPASANLYRQAAQRSGNRYEAFLSVQGGNDRMLLLVNSGRFTVDETGADELEHDGGNGSSRIQFPGGDARRPFLVRLRDKQNGNQSLIFMANHLNRGNAASRQLQARGLREWARRQSAPIIAVGDYNFDYDFRNLTGNVAMTIFLRRENTSDRSDRGQFVWNWIIPGSTFEIARIDESAPAGDANRKVLMLTEWIDSNWDGSARGEDDFRDSILDFIFVAGPARDWAAQASVIVRPGDFPDNDDTSDHRPLMAILDPSKRSTVDVGGPRD